MRKSDVYKMMDDLMSVFDDEYNKVLNELDADNYLVNVTTLHLILLLKLRIYKKFIDYV